MKINKAVVVLSLAAMMVTAGCGILSSRSGEAEQARLGQAEVARARAQTETRVAVAKPGAKVCRELILGIGVPEVIRGVVIAVEGDRVQVRIEDPGRYPMTVGGEHIRSGMVLQDPAGVWTLCL